MCLGGLLYYNQPVDLQFLILIHTFTHPKQVHMEERGRRSHPALPSVGRLPQLFSGGHKDVILLIE